MAILFSAFSHLFRQNLIIIIGRRGCACTLRLSRKIWGVVEEFIVLDMKDPTPREEENLQLNDQPPNVIYEALDPKISSQSKT